MMLRPVIYARVRLLIPWLQLTSQLKFTPGTFIIILTLLLYLSGLNAVPAGAQTGPDLLLTKTVDRTRVKIGENIVYTITVTNLGPGMATNVVFGDPLPDQLNLVAFDCLDGTDIGNFCLVESLSSGASASAIYVATPTPGKQERRITNTAFTSEETTANDPNPSNNSASVTIRVIGRLTKI